MVMKQSLMIYLFAVFLIIIGCSNNDSNEESSSTKSEQVETSELNVLLVDDLGNKVNIPSSPERVIAPYLEDDLLTIDVMPITQWSLHEGESIQDYLQDDLGDIP